MMGNAPPELKAMAAVCGWTLAPTQDEDGVAVMLEGIFGRDPGDVKRVHEDARPDSEMPAELVVLGHG